MTEAFVYDAVRTPFGKHGGSLAGSDPTTLLPTFSSSWSGVTPALIRRHRRVAFRNATARVRRIAVSCSAVICIGVGQGLAVVLENVAD